MKLPTLSDVCCLLTVHETGSFSAAAHKIGVRQSAVSMAIKRLETQLEAKLLLRTKKGLILTNAGEILVGRSPSILAEWEKMIDAITFGPREIAGHFVISAPQPVAVYSLPKPINVMMKKYPLLEFRILTEHSAFISKQLHSFKCDIGIILNPLPDTKLEFHWLATRYIGLWKLNSSRVPEDVFIYTSGMTVVQELLLKAKAAGLVFKRMLEVGSIEAAAGLVSAGAGIGLLPSLLVENQVAKNLQAVFPDSIRSNFEIYLAIRKEAKMPSALEYIIDTLIAYHYKA